MIEVGEMAPDFTLASDENRSVTLSEFRGRKVVLYFYPKDDTPGCTIQACDFRDSLPRFEGVEVTILGISPDSVDSHRAFREKFDLNFTLLADVDADVARRYGVWKDQRLERSTFLISEEGVVEKLWRKVAPAGHTEMLAELLEA
jgi:thioredoxin-dependent peroxiredoxin